MKEFENEVQDLVEANNEKQNNAENEVSDDEIDEALNKARAKAKDSLMKKHQEMYLRKSRNTKAIISEWRKKDGPASAIYKVKINLFNEEGTIPYYKTLTDETIDEAADLFDKLFSQDPEQTYFSFEKGNIHINGESPEGIARKMGNSMGLDINGIDLSSEKGIKLQKALFIHAIVDKNNKLTVNGLDEKGDQKEYEVKLPEKTAAQKKQEETARALVEEDKKHFNGMREDEIPGFVKLEKDIYQSRNEICSLSFNSEEARNDPDHSFDPRRLSEEEYNKALEVYEKVFKNFKNQKGLINPGLVSLYTNVRTIAPYYFTFTVNGQRMTPEMYLRNVQKVDENDTFINDNDQKVAVIYLMTRFDLRASSLDGKKVEFSKVTPDMEAPKDIVAEAGKVLHPSALKKAEKEDVKPMDDSVDSLNDNPINDPVKVQVKDPQREKVISIDKNKDVKTSKYDIYASNALLPGIEKTPEMKIDAISKVMAAHALKVKGIAFDVKKIDKIAKHFKELYCLDDLKNHPHVDQAVSSVDQALSFGETARKNLYTVRPDQYESYSDEMKELLKNMQGKKGRTDEYKELYDAIQEAAELQEKTASMSKAEKASAYRNSNIRIVEAVKKYIKGKKSPRTITSRKDRFDNALDSLAIVVKTNQNSAIRIYKMIADINTHRNADKKINVNSFATTYGVERARTRGPIYNKNVAKAVQNTAKVKGGMKMAM